MGRKLEDAKAWIKKQAKSVKVKACDVAEKVVGWIETHPTESVTLGLAIVGITGKAISVAAKNAKVKQEEELKDLYVYDRSLGNYWKLRHRPTQSEMLEIERRKASGERDMARSLPA